MKLSIIEARILSLVYKSSHSLNAFTVYRRLRLTYKDFYNSINSLIEKGFVEETNERYQITSLGKEFLIKKKYYLKKENKIWRQVPTDFIQNSINTNELYVPRIALLDSRQFKKD